MIFPNDVEKTTNDARKIVGNEKTKLILVAIAAVNVVVALWATSFFGGFGVPAWIILSVQAVLMGMIFVYIYRIFIFGEEEKLQESEDKTTDSFSKYYKIRNTDASLSVRGRDIEYPAFEFDNGSYAMYIKFLYGANSTEKAKGNSIVLEKILNLLATAGLEASITVGSENFETSPEAKDLLHTVNSITNVDLASKMTGVVHNLLEVSKEFSNVDVLMIRIRTLKTYQRYELGSVITRIKQISGDHQTSFRSVSVVLKKPLLDFFRDFYELEAIDLALMKIRDSRLSSDAGRKLVELYMVSDEEGHAFVRKDLMEKEIKTARKLNL